ncbi:MAG: FecCD family ABC transporter permease [Micrococcaceae bacterium]
MSIDFGYRAASLNSSLVSGRYPTRALMVAAVLFLLGAAFALVSITLGEYPLTLGEVWATLLGNGQSFHETIVMKWRLPVALSAVLFGALLGIGGAIFQSLTRNPLGSPDVIGFDAGSYTAVVIAVLVVGQRSYWTMAGASIAGGLLTAFAVYILAYRKGIQGFRLIIVGVGVAAVLGSLNSYLITRAKVEDAMVVGFWGAGSLNRVHWESLIPTALIAVVVLLGVALASPALQRLEMGDDAAITLGTRPNAARLVLLVLGVATTAIVTAAAGPIGFIALVAPQLARRLTGAAGAGLLPAAAMGSALLGFAHIVSLLLSMYVAAVPVGLVTVCVGGIYLLWLLVRESRRQFGPAA